MNIVDLDASEVARIESRLLDPYGRRQSIVGAVLKSNYGPPR